MRAGLPVVVADVGGAGEAVRDDETGFLFERSNADQLAHRLRRLTGDPELRGAMGTASRRLFEAEFTFERMYRRTSEIYESVLGTAAMTEPVMEI
jgi:glycosyltransferase involved in cell wall biosynthesis